MGRPNPSGLLLTEYIGQVERTQGTETSKYLEEKKSTEIAQVAASERAVAQTGATFGCTEFLEIKVECDQMWSRGCGTAFSIHES